MKIKFEFYFSTHYVGSTVTEDVELEFDDDASEEEIEKQIEEAWIEWRNKQCDGGWKRKE